MRVDSVLVIDDEPDMQLALAHSLKKKGCQVQCAGNGAEGLKKFKDQPFGLVITDMRMPEMSGMQVLKGIRKLSPQVPVIMMTAYGSVNNAVTAMQAGATDYIQKPFSLETLSTTIQKVCADSTGSQPQAGGSTNILDSLQEKKTITQDPEMLAILDMAGRVAKSDATILILGENGTGKELLASFIHQKSRRRSGPLVAINCAALQETLAESELFGHARGAFTGAFNSKEGRFELANQGTLLLDEVSELSPSLQAKILRALQEREIDRVGGQRPRPIDVRIVAISNRDLSKAVREGRFREDLFYRLNVVALEVPSLKERQEDIPLLAQAFLERFASKNRKTIKGYTPAAMSQLMNAPWPGNIRELMNTIERGVILTRAEFLDNGDFSIVNQSPQEPIPETSLITSADILPLENVEKTAILKALEQLGGNKSETARQLGITRRTLHQKLKRYGVM